MMAALDHGRARGVDVILGDRHELWHVWVFTYARDLHYSTRGPCLCARVCAEFPLFHPGVELHTTHPIPAHPTQSGLRVTRCVWLEG